MFKDWLRKSSKGDRYFFCEVCDNHCTTVGGKSNVLKHRRSAKHSLNSSMLKKQPPIRLELNLVKNKIINQQKEGEIRILITSFIAEHSIPLNVADHLTTLIKNVCPDSDIAKNISCSRTKCTKIVQNVTGNHQFQKIVNILRTEKFSLIVDEYTNINEIKQLALVARYFHESHINDSFLALFPVAIVTAEALYKCITDFFNAHKIPYKCNLIGFASDGASNMFGRHQSLSVLLKKDVSYLFLVKCTCHSFALCASYACEKLPRVVEDLARDIYNYIQHSYKRVT